MRGRNYRLFSGPPYSRKEYIHGAPPPKITKFTMGNPKGSFSYRMSLISLARVQIRHNALEAARIAINKALEEKLSPAGYLLHIRVYPHHVLRENKMIATAGADRLQEGMRRAFGKPVGRAARVKINQPVIDVYVDGEGLEAAKEALKVASSKLPIPSRILVTKLDGEGAV